MNVLAKWNSPCNASSTSPDIRPINSVPYRKGPKARGLKKMENRQDVSNEHHRDGTIKMRFTYRVCPKERQISPILYWLSKVERCYRQRCVSDTLKELMHRLTWWSRIFSTLSASSGYWQIEIDERDCDKTTFTSYHWLYRFICRLFVRKSALSTFQHAMDVILLTVNWQFALIYLYDIVMLSKSVSNNLSRHCLVLGLLSDAGMSLKLKKCFIFVDKVDYLSHVIKLGKLRFGTRRLMPFLIWTSQQTWQNWSRPSACVMGPVDLFPNLDWKTVQLSKKLTKDQSFHFDGLHDVEEQALLTLQTSRCHHWCWPHCDQPDDMCWTLTYAMSQSDASCLMENQKVLQSPLNTGCIPQNQAEQS